MANFATRLKKLLRLETADINRYLAEDINDAHRMAVEEFEKILDELRQASASGTFEKYYVAFEDDTETIRLPRSGETIRVPTRTVWVQSPYENLNVFDILDTGRKALPERGPDQSPYPLWSLRTPTATLAPGQQARSVQGRFVAFQKAKGVWGIRPEPQRFDLQGPYRKDGPKPVAFTRKRIKAVPKRDLYRRIGQRVDSRLKRAGYKGYSVRYRPQGRD